MLEVEVHIKSYLLPIRARLVVCDAYSVGPAMLLSSTAFRSIYLSALSSFLHISTMRTLQVSQL